MSWKSFGIIVFLGCLNLHSNSDKTILQIKNKIPSLRHETRQLQKTPDEIRLLNHYLDSKYKNDPDLRSYFLILKDSKKWTFDNFVAGTWPQKDVVTRIDEVLPEKQKNRDEILKLFSKLLENPNLQFGYDGFEQNGCAAPTAFLLILDNLKGRVDGIDLVPCQE
jgi:hypothetical protein